jgi:hypothetical protein
MAVVLLDHSGIAVPQILRDHQHPRRANERLAWTRDGQSPQRISKKKSARSGPDGPHFVELGAYSVGFRPFGPSGINRNIHGHCRPRFQVGAESPGVKKGWPRPKVHAFPLGTLYQEIYL